MAWACCVTVLMVCIGFVQLFKIEESQMKQWSANFKTELDTHINTVLGYKQVQGMLRKYESDLLIVPIKGQDTFTNIYTNVNLKYTDLIEAVTKLKTGIEKQLVSQTSDEPSRPGKDAGQKRNGDEQSHDTGFPSPGDLGPVPPLLSGGGGGEPGAPVKPLLKCCQRDRTWKYNGRFRDDVKMKECYENVDDTLRNISEAGLENIFKENLVKSTAVTWQYFADTSGHYIQYPANNRMCEGTSLNSTSPLLAEWFVEKLFVERKNLVILVDNGLLTTTGDMPTDRDLMIEAVKQTLKTLTPNDKVNIVTLQQSTGGRWTPEGCHDKLYVATQGNLDRLEKYISNLPYGIGSSGDASLAESLKHVYQLYQAELKINEAGFKSRTNLVLVLLSGQSLTLDEDGNQLLEMIAQQQQQLDHSVQHFVYMTGEPSNDTVTSLLARVADQNNCKLNLSAGIEAKPWPPMLHLVDPKKPVGKEGLLKIVETRTAFPVTVATYFKRLPSKVDNSHTTAIVPVMDKTSGLMISIAAAVYSGAESVPSGVTSVDASLESVFSDVINIDVGESSYAFLVDMNHGHVLLHPKLRDATDTRSTLFPRLQLLEPDLSESEIQAILKASENLGIFKTNVSHGRTTISGELVRSRTSQKEPVTVYHQLVYGTSLCVVFFHFLSDREEARLQKQQQQVSLHAPYHRIDELVPAPIDNKPDHDNVCHLHDNFLSFKESVVKLSPWVFKDPVQYKYEVETLDQIVELNKFIISDGPTSLIREDMKMLIQHFVRSTDQLDSIWKVRDKEIIERFVGSTSGVFRLYPGSPLDNTFDHTHTDWYKRSIAFPGVTMYHYGRLSFINQDKVVIISKALLENSRLQGVIGMTTTRRQVTSQLVQSVPGCYGGDTQCHIVDSSGNILDSFTDGEDSHLSNTYPWLIKALAVKNKLVVDWCTAFSDGFHKEIFELTEAVTSDTTARDQCKQYSLRNVRGTNLFILILGNRTALKCVDSKYEVCTSCQNVPPNGPFGLTIPKCQLCLSNLTTECQCPCYCDTDLDLCEGQFKDNTPSFPGDACFYPSKPNTRLELLPDSPGPDSGLEFCPLPCAAMEDIGLCVQLNHCKLSTGHYPTCIWKDDQELKNSKISRFFPTSTPKPPPSPPPRPGTKHTGNSGTKHTVGPVTGETPSQSVPSLASTDVTTSSPVTRRSTFKPKPTQTHTFTSLPSVVSTSPKFVHHVSGPSQLPTSTAVQLHPISGSSTISQGLVSSSTAKALSANRDDSEKGGMTGGAITGLVIGIIVLLLIFVFVAIKLYNKKFRKPGADNSSKYRARSSVFDSTIFNRSSETVVTGIDQSSDVPYEQIQQT